MEKNRKSERISKVIARSTPHSRRQVEQFILDGRVKIDGKISFNLVLKSNLFVINAL